MAALILIFALVSTFFISDASPTGYGYRNFPRTRRGYHQQPQAMMFSGFYGPQHTPSSGYYGQQGAMSAFANKDMVFTNSFAGEEMPIYLNPQEQGQNQGQSFGQNQGQTQGEIQGQNQEEILVGPNETPATTRKPQKNKRKSTTTTTKPIEEIADSDEEEDDEDVDAPEVPELPVRGAKQPQGPENPQSPYNPSGGNTYFPVLFGQSPNGRNGGGSPGGAIAIANAYSTGKGGVASSHATAYGDPYFSRLPQKMKPNKKRPNGGNKTRN